MLQKHQKIFKVISFFLLAVIVLGGVFYGGVKYGVEKKYPNVTNKNESDLISSDFSIFWDSIGIIKEKYFKIDQINDKEFVYGAIKGALGALDDPYSSFFNPPDAKKFTQDLNGSFGGIGAEIGIKNGQFMIVAPLKGNPAEKVGLRAGDAILKIDDKITNDLPVDAAVKLIRGEPGTVVRLTIFREGSKDSEEFKITRAIIQVPTLEWKMLEESKTGGKKIAYIQLYNFNANAPQLFYQAALGALLKGSEGIVLDLRNNPGGFLDVATELAGWFVSRGDVVVQEKFRSGEGKNYIANGNSALERLPVVILANGGSASASEILAGALRDKRGAKIVGEKTFGKGTVQEVQDLKDGSSLKISIAEWLTPNGSEINKKGLSPDFEVKPGEDDGRDGKDSQLEKAIEVLLPQISEDLGPRFSIKVN